MNEKIKAAFGEIEAEQELKTTTKYFLYDRYNNLREPKRAFLPVKIPVAAAVCLLVVICTSVFTYITPVSAISLDGNTSSVELGVNRFDKVVKITCFGDTRAADVLTLKNSDYREAVSALLEQTEDFDDSTVLTVNCKNSEKATEMAEEIHNCHPASASVHHQNGNHAISAEAHNQGISTGKYQAYLILKEYEPALTVDEARNMTMKELRERISLHTEESDSTNGVATAPSATQTECSSPSSGHHQHKNGNH